MVLALTLSLLTLVNNLRGLEIGESQLLQDTNSYPWILALMDAQNEVSCNANLVSNIVSITACECLVDVPINSSSALKVRHGSDERYSLLGGVLNRSDTDMDSKLVVQTISFHVHERCNLTNVFNVRNWVYNFGVVSHHPFDAHIGFRLEQMPTWSRDPVRMEIRYRELVNTGQTCYIAGWTSTNTNSARLKVKMYEGYNCSKFACRATMDGHGQCSPVSVACTRNSTSSFTLPYCNLEPGMPLICGPTADTYAITEGSTCGLGQINFLWKVSVVLDWIESYLKYDISVFIQNETMKKNEKDTEKGHFFHTGHGGCMKFEPTNALPFIIMKIYLITALYGAIQFIAL